MSELESVKKVVPGYQFKVPLSLDGEAPFPKKKPLPKGVLPKIEPISEDEWAKLNGKAKWDSTVALRGPDLVGSEALKFFTSSVIRHKLSGIMRVGGLVNRTIPFVILPNDYGSLSKGSFDLGHFREHIYEAATWLQIPICYVEMETFKKLFVNNHVSAAAAALGDLHDPFKLTLETYLGIKTEPKEGE